MNTSSSQRSRENEEFSFINGIQFGTYQNKQAHNPHVLCANWDTFPDILHPLSLFSQGFQWQNYPADLSGAAAVIVG